MKSALAALLSLLLAGSQAAFAASAPIATSTARSAVGISVPELRLGQSSPSLAADLSFTALDSGLAPPTALGPEAQSLAGLAAAAPASGAALGEGAASEAAVSPAGSGLAAAAPAAVPGAASAALPPSPRARARAEVS
ncbi:MAG TPA: hypothetical protein VNI01_00035, partial [Elusimicrobiota bacterium]|nr:hypothetical protein [Elusimicrobiota bacterium]